MMRLFACASLVMCSLVSAPSPLAAADRGEASRQGEEFFEKHVRPILVARCQKCHGPEKQESDLRLDSASGLAKGGATGEPLTSAAAPEQSFLIRAVRHEGDIQMPPEERLPEAEVAVLLEWIRAGTPWPAATPVASLSDRETVLAARATHWAFQPLRRPELPDVRDSADCQTAMDRYLQAKRESAGLTASPEADRRTLLRRLSFDLLGLPPTAADADAFARDERPDAVERVVDRLLASPHYGERWGRHWLDVARYADTKGYAFAKERRYPYAYTYRDYVIGAYNEDLPLHRFIVEQIAADQLDGLAGAGSQAEQGRVTSDQSHLAALGFLTTGRRFNNRHDDIDDQIDVVTRGLMGLTVACARCHDHKFDPIPTEDYYSLYGVFANTHEPQELPLIGAPEDSAAYREFKQQLDKQQEQVDQYRREKHAELLDATRQRTVEYLVRASSQKSDELLNKLPFLSLNRDDLRPKLIVRWRAFLGQRNQPADPVFGLWSELAKVPPAEFSGGAAAQLAASLARETGTGPGQLNPLVRQAFAEAALTAPEDVARIYGELLAATYRRWREAGGNAAAEAGLSEAERQVLQLLTGSGTPTDIGLDEVEEYLNRAERNRLRELQKKLESLQATSPAAPPRAMIVADNAQPGNSRVLIRGNPGRPGKEVPRQFPLVVAGPERQPFARGSGRLELAQAIVADDNPLTRRVLMNRVWMHHFGEPLVATPSDFGLRCETPLQRELLDYLAGRLAEQDWRLKPIHREILLSQAYRQSSDQRPEALAADPENRYLWRMNRRRLEFEAFRDALLEVSGRLDTALGGRPDEITRPESRRRTVYAYIDRQDLPGLFRVFDFPSPDQSNERRSRTTVPQQALFAMNSDFAVVQVRAIAQALPASDDPAQRVNALYRILLSRDVREQERSIAVDFVKAAGAGQAAGTGQAARVAGNLGPWEQLAQLLLMTNEFTFVD